MLVLAKILRITMKCFQVADIFLENSDNAINNVCLISVWDVAITMTSNSVRCLFMLCGC